jgi:YidC/Oxa1 family membrane protein insertase
MSNSPGAVPPEPPSFEKRLPLALALMMLVLLAWQYFFKPAPVPKSAVPAASPTVQVAGQKPFITAPEASAPTPPFVHGQSPPAGPLAPVQGSSESISEIDSNLYHIVFTNRGAMMKSWVLKKYKDDAGKPLQLIDPDSKIALPFALDFSGQKPAFDVNAVLYRAQVSNGGNTIDFDYSDGATSIHKSFEFKKDNYLSTVSSVVLDHNANLPHLLTWRGGFGDSKVFKASTKINTIHYDTAAGKLVKKVAKDAKNGPFSETGSFTFGGIEDEFFAAVALPPDNTPLEIRTYSDDVRIAGESEPVQYVGFGLSTGPQNSLSLFVGPKDTHLLEGVNPKLGTLIDWGFFGIIAKPLFQSLNWVATHWTGNNYGWAIILVTLIINTALFPIRLSSLKSARKMQKLQPQLKAINEKYKNIKINDPRKAEQNQEVMALYKNQGVNPVGGCLPLILQLPFFYAFYKVLSISIDLRHAPWLWVSDLSNPETFFIHVLPLVMIATQFFMQKMTPAAGVDPNQQRMMMFMPLMLGFFFYNLSSGLVLYYLTGNIVGIVFQLIVNRFMPAPVPPPSAPPKAPVKSTVKK